LRGLLLGAVAPAYGRWTSLFTLKELIRVRIEDAAD
jgi:hypothetical protein